MADNEKCIGVIGNYYGGLVVKKENGKFFWSITNYDGDEWEEITKELYESLIKYEKDRLTIKKDAKP